MSNTAFRDCSCDPSGREKNTARLQTEPVSNQCDRIQLLKRLVQPDLFRACCEVSRGAPVQESKKVLLH
ncbi:MAG: hypothetical protein CR997_11565 [Acidobacteria bacterium]|nr:MAG: hypothetical protein CR997_11565 [Acidobacteriota bacterium]